MLKKGIDSRFNYMPTIRKLPVKLISQIAAGETVERPSSVFKELLENSIDASSTKIAVYLEKGGIKRMIIADNGCGIPSEQLPLALERHATSKINSLYDLENVSTLGFRGEALSSIASVSELTMISRTADTTYASKIDGGSMIVTPACGALGTTVDIRNLYFNMPARRKFLKSEQIEFSHCAEAIRRVALVRPDIFFSLVHNRKIIYHWGVGGVDKRSASILGKDFANARLFLDEKSNLLHLRGFIGLPIASRSRNNAQYFYVNGRFVRDKVVVHALRTAYQDVLHSDRYPCYVLELFLDPTLVDVNVHPSKIEVRFRDSQLVHQFLFNTVTRELAKNSAVPLYRTIKPVSNQHIEGYLHENTQSDMNIFQHEASHDKKFDAPKRDVEESILEQNFSSNNTDKCVISTNYLGNPILKQDPRNVPLSENFLLGFALAQLHGDYILAQNTKGLIVVNIHAARERILYEDLKSSSENNQPQVKYLLTPVTFFVNEREMDTVKKALGDLSIIGFNISIISPTTLAVLSVPILLEHTNIQVLVPDMLKEIYKFGKSHISIEYRNRILAILACHTVAYTNNILTLQEMNNLLRKIEALENTNSCNPDRPTWIQMPMSDLSKSFLRDI